jgi:hypothetical protein
VAELGVLGKSSMAKGMTITGMVVAVLIFLLFALDLAVGVPFRKASLLIDIAFLICSIGLGFLSWTTWREFEK